MKRTFLTTFLAFLFLSQLQAQNTDLEASGIVYGNQGLPLAQVKLALLKDGVIATNQITKPNGLFSFALDFGHLYKLTFTKAGYASQQVVFNTQGLSEEERNFTYKLTRIRLSLMEGDDKTHPERVQNFIFDHEQGNFVNQK